MRRENLPEIYYGELLRQILCVVESIDRRLDLSLVADPDQPLVARAHSTHCPDWSSTDFHIMQKTS